MNGVHDMGGMQCFGSLDLEDERMFKHEWERQVLALALAMGATGVWNLDQSRAARESLPAGFYLNAGYYRIWLAALENLLVENGLVTRAELDSGVSQCDARPVPRILKNENVALALKRGSPVDRTPPEAAHFAIGSKVTVRNLHRSTHTRLPSYIRQRTGYVAKIHGCHVFPDTHAVGQGEQPQWLYNIRFDNRELWGESACAGSVHVDCWESYLTQSHPDSI